jgi:hypothetical protein
MIYIVPAQRLAVVVMTNLEDAPERLETLTATGDIVAAPAQAR